MQYVCGCFDGSGVCGDGCCVDCDRVPWFLGEGSAGCFNAGGTNGSCGQFYNRCSGCGYGNPGCGCCSYGLNCVCKANVVPCGAGCGGGVGGCAPLPVAGSSPLFVASNPATHAATTTAATASAASSSSSCAMRA